MYEANIYKIHSTGIDKAAFDETPSCPKHGSCKKAKKANLNKKRILYWAPTESQGNGQDEERGHKGI